MVSLLCNEGIVLQNPTRLGKYVLWVDLRLDIYTNNPKKQHNNGITAYKGLKYIRSPLDLWLVSCSNNPKKLQNLTLR